jgi:hypothetical protein
LAPSAALVPQRSPVAKQAAPADIGIFVNPGGLHGVS